MLIKIFVVETIDWGLKYYFCNCLALSTLTNTITFSLESTAAIPYHPITILSIMIFNINLWLVIEVEKGGKDKGSEDVLDQVYIIESSKNQLYRVRSLNERTHFQIDDDQEMNEYLARLEDKGLEEIDSPDVQSDSTLFFTFLHGNENHYLPEITIFNNLQESVPSFMLSQIRLRDWAEHLTKPVNAGKSECGTRGCVKLDIGFCPQSYKDPDVVKGMNAPKFTTKHDRFLGLDGDSSITASMIESAIGTNFLRSSLSRTHDLSWEGDFNHDRRLTLFANRAAESHVHLHHTKFVFEGVTIGVTGTLPDGRTVKILPHRDILNGIGAGYDVYYSFSSLVVLKRKGGEGYTTVRVSIGCYGKKCVDDFLLRLDANEKLYRAISTWRNNNPELFHIDSYLLKFTADATHRLVRPRADKKLYYSIYIEGVLKLGQIFSYDMGVLFEAVYLITMCPSPLGWYNGVMAAAHKRGDGNLVEAFVNHMVDLHGAVSSGEGRRRQVSHKRSVTRANVYHSLMNMMTLAASSVAENNTQEYIKNWSKGPENGGVYGARELISQEQIYILTALGVIKNYKHAIDAQIAKGTETADRLRKWKITKDSHRAEIMRYVCARMKISPYVAENMFCEFLRFAAKEESVKSFPAKDAIIKGQGIYTLMGGVLTRTDVEGTTEMVDMSMWGFDRIVYSGGVRWWKKGFRPLAITGELTLTINEKKGDVPASAATKKRKKGH